MTTATGIEIAAQAAAVTVRSGATPAVVTSSVRPVAVGMGADGTLAPTDPTAPGALAGFAGLLGQTEPVMVGPTPYGVEALFAPLIGAGVADAAVASNDAAADDADAAPVIALAHDDGIDEYRRGLLVEAARLAGVPVEAVETVTRSEALAALASSGLDVPEALAVATGAALVALQRRPAAVAEGSTGAAVAGATGLAAGAGAAAVIAGTAGDPTAVAAEALAGPAGTPLASAASGPVGAPLGGAAAGPTGTPMAGTQFGAAATKTTAAGGKSFTAAVKAAGVKAWAGAAVATVVVAGGIGYAATRGDDKEAAPAATTTTVTTTTVAAAAPGTTLAAPVATAVASASESNTTEAPAVTAAEIVPVGECIVGNWVMDNDVFASLVAGAVAAEGGTIGVASGVISAAFSPDGAFSISFEDWTVVITTEFGEGFLASTGTDRGTWTANADGTYTVQLTEIGTSSVITVTAEGQTFSIPAGGEGALQGVQTAQCSATTLNILQIEGDLEYIPLVRN